MNNENEAVIDGVTYKAVDGDGSCLKCVAYRRDDMDLCTKLPPCGSVIRKDKRNTVFVEV